jgi:predicted TPR repeat methyltransferase
MMSTLPETAAPEPSADAADTLQQAMQAHGSGRLDEAGALYRSVLTANPDHADALHLSGVLQAQMGQHQNAAELIARAIELQPAEAMFHNNLGNVYMERSQIAQAEACYQRALELDAGRLDALNNLGVLWSTGQRPDDAERALRHVMQQAPDFADARQNLANHYLRVGRVVDAVQLCCDGLIVAPRHAGMRYLLGMAYSLMGRNDEAIAVYRAWLEAEPGNVRALFHLAACTGVDVPERAPDDYVKRVFDNFASSFDAKLAALSYQAPAQVAAAVARHAGLPAKALRVLDAGCGTGLCGPLLAPYAQHLTGVDLSEGMLRNALAVNAYDALLMGDLVAFLDMRPGGFDLIASADTLCYFGALEAFAAAAAGALSAGGLLIFTVEAHDDAEPMPPFRLQPNGRYSHRSTYVERVLSGAGLSIVENLPVVLRTEASAPVQGRLVTARAVLPC